MSLQGLTVAVSPIGIEYFVNVLLAGEISSALQKLTLPDRSISVPDLVKWDPPVDINEVYENIVVALSGGAVFSFNPTFQTLTQQANGNFLLIMVASNFKATYRWNEQYNDVEYISGTSTIFKTTPVNNNYDYSVAFAEMTIAITFKLEFTNNEVGLTFISAVPNPGNVSPNIPSGSIIDPACYSNQLSDATQKAIDSVDFSGPISAVVKPLFQSIPASGQLTPDIAFNFQLGPSGLNFPGNAGVATGATGDTSYKGTRYPGNNPPQLALSPIPPGHHLNYFASDYTFNSLLWAFFQAGDLVATATPGNIPDGQVLNTATYANSALKPLYTAYPNLPMTANIAALAPPVMQFAQVYDLTAANIGKLQTQLPAPVYTQLQVLKGSVFMDEPSFFAALKNVLGDANAVQYKAVIEAVAAIIGAVVAHSNQVILNVIQAGNTIPVITFNVSQTDVLQDFVLGIFGKTQTLQFAFQIVLGLTTTKFISSSIAGIDSGDFGDIWNFALQPVFAGQVAKIGQAGVALPRLQGFNFIFSNASITLQPGYASVLADVQHVSDDGKFLRPKKSDKAGSLRK
jgi:hypothetical protein